MLKCHCVSSVGIGVCVCINIYHTVLEFCAFEDFSGVVKGPHEGFERALSAS